MDRIAPGVIALLIAALLTVVVFVPFVAISYRRRGGLSAARTLGWIAVLAYALGVWAYTLLPFPDDDGFRCLGPQLVPFGSIGAIWTDPSGFDLIRNQAFQQVVLNVLLTVPLGVLLRAMWRRGVVTSLIVGFLLSLLIETTQLTGVWGLYSCAYRLFDVDDLILNTLGAVIGSLLSWLVLRRRSQAAAPRAARDEPRPVTATRRLLGMFCDWLAAALTSIAASILLTLFLVVVVRVDDSAPWLDPVATVFGTLVAFTLHAAALLSSGSTLGERAVLLLGVDARRVGLGRIIRLMLGLGGFLLVGLLPDPVVFPAQFVFVAVTVIGALTTSDRRGFASSVAGMSIRDARDSEGVRSGSV